MKKTLTAAAADEGFFKKYGFYLALLVLCVIISLPTPDGLSVAGHRMLGIMVFSVIVWATTAISYPVSAGVIIALMALLIGFAPNPATGKIFGTAAGLASAIIPIIISVLQQLKTPGVNVIGMTMILQYVVSFGFILPVNAPQNMIAYGTNTFEVRDFARSGIPLTLIGFALIMLLGSTYWKWLGLV